MIDPLTSTAELFQLFLIALALVTLASTWFVVMTPRTLDVRLVFSGLVVLACLFLCLLAMAL